MGRGEPAGPRGATGGRGETGALGVTAAVAGRCRSEGKEYTLGAVPPPLRTICLNLARSIPPARLIARRDLRITTEGQTLRSALRFGACVVIIW